MRQDQEFIALKIKHFTTIDDKRAILTRDEGRYDSKKKTPESIAFLMNKKRKTDETVPTSLVKKISKGREMAKMANRLGSGIKVEGRNISPTQRSQINYKGKKSPITFKEDFN